MSETLSTLSDVLRQLLETRREELRAFDYIKHPTIIGDAYESLTKSMLERSIPHGLNLSVKKGFIRNNTGELSHQVDCMIVEGEGVQYPGTDHWVYPSQNVVMYLEVKKRLYTADLKDGLVKMSHFSRVVADPKEIRLNLAQDAWHSIVGMPFRGPQPTDSPTAEMVYHSLIRESAMPVRVILGYEGFASEESLRSALIDLLGQKDEEGHNLAGPLSLPNLIVARHASLVKTNGMPYSVAKHPFKDWTLLASSPDNPLLILLELLWCKLTYFHGAPAKFMGEDLQCEFLDPLLSAQIVDGAWALNSHSFRSAKMSGTTWAPHELDECEFVVLDALCKDKEVSGNDPEFLAYLAMKGETVEGLAQKLQGKRLAALDGGKFTLLTKKLLIGFAGDKCLAADDHAGRFSLWMERWIAERASSVR